MHHPNAAMTARATPAPVTSRRPCGALGHDSIKPDSACRQQLEPRDLAPSGNPLHDRHRHLTSYLRGRHSARQTQAAQRVDGAGCRELTQAPIPGAAALAGFRLAHGPAPITAKPAIGARAGSRPSERLPSAVGPHRRGASTGKAQGAFARVAAVSRSRSAARCLLSRRARRGPRPPRAAKAANRA